MREIKYSGINIEIKGRLTAEPQVNMTPSGKTVAKATVALQGGYVSKERAQTCPNGWKETYNENGYEYTVFARVTAWQEKADQLSVYAKGQTIHLEVKLSGQIVDGVLNPRVWTSRQGGGARASWEFQVLGFVDEAPEEATGLDDAGEEYDW